MEMFCKDLTEQAMKIINYEKKEMIPLTNEEKESYKNQKVCYICEKEFSTNKKDQKVRDHCHYTGKYREELPIIVVIYVIKYQKRFL